MALVVLGGRWGGGHNGRCSTRGWATEEIGSSVRQMTREGMERPGRKEYRRRCAARSSLPHLAGVVVRRPTANHGSPCLTSLAHSYLMLEKVGEGVMGTGVLDLPLHKG
jgi:hypothetical protein